LPPAVLHVERAASTEMAEGLGANTADPLTTLNESAIFGGVQSG